MASDTTARAERAKARRLWPIHRTALGSEPSEDLSGTTTAEQRLAMMWPLAREAWSLTGRPWPEYARADMPGRVIRPEHRPDDPR